MLNVIYILSYKYISKHLRTRSKKGNKKVPHSVRIKIRNPSWFSGYYILRSRIKPGLDSRFRSIFRNFPVSEMLAVQFSNCENLRISFEHKHK